MAEIDPIIDEVLEEEPGELLTEAPPTPTPPTQTGIDENERKTWEGRVQAEQRKFDVMDAQLASNGYKVDRATGQIVPISGYAQPQQPPPVEEEEFDPYDVNAIDKRIESRVEARVNQVLSQLTPLIDQSLEPAISAGVSDWAEIKTDVMSRAREMGFSTLGELRQNPALFDLFADAARGKRGMAAPAPSVPTAEPEPSRDELLAMAVSGGGGNPPAARGRANFTPEALQAIANEGYTPEQLMAVANGKVSIDVIGGGKK